MSRKKKADRRTLLPDPKFGEVLVTRMVNTILRSGKRGIAERAFYGALDQIEKKAGSDPVKLFHKAIENVRPLVEVRSRRVGGATYQVPTEVKVDRGQSLAIRWVAACANDRGERTIADRIAGELMDAANNKGNAIKKREDTHRMAEANKAFAHFKW